MEGAQEMCQLYGSLGSERESLSRRHARRREKEKGKDVETKDTLGEFQKGRRSEGRRKVREQVDRGVGRVIAPRGMSRMQTGVKGSTVHCHVEREKETSTSDYPSTAFEK